MKTENKDITQLQAITNPCVVGAGEGYPFWQGKTLLCRMYTDTTSQPHAERPLAHS